MTANRKNVVLVSVLCAFTLVYGAMGAQAVSDEGGEQTFATSVNGWDLKILESNTGAVAITTCTLSSTMLAHPSVGAQGGRVTTGFESRKDGMVATVTVTGGMDEGQPIEIWVDDHLIADQKPKSGVISLSPKISENVATLFKAGRGGAIRFYRKGRLFDVPLSLDGFTRAARDIRRQCSTVTG